ncbi:MAG: Arc family DNA-binding protein [Algisphaera sp.]
MAQLIVRNLEDDVRDKLRDRAQTHGRSMEEEVRDILRAAVVQDHANGTQGLGSRIARIFASTNELAGETFNVEPWRGGAPEPMDFDE